MNAFGSVAICRYQTKNKYATVHLFRETGGNLSTLVIGKWYDCKYTELQSLLTPCLSSKHSFTPHEEKLVSCETFTKKMNYIVTREVRCSGSVYPQTDNQFDIDYT